ncbi:hypothetical protein L1987_48967 [Smallanthus sonchifolius]|uniref:Uncharacterized protein n=1 Tax=Smallanthus sonchifolius TaxID=185202 RepID=A0ACB9FTG0_9ASTR|nr:hypothetical protein L1987_48967 [Smallanthus sonchifolius]
MLQELHTVNSRRSWILDSTVRSRAFNRCSKKDPRSKNQEPSKSMSCMCKKQQYMDIIRSNFRGEDTRKSFTDHLYAALKQAGIRTFSDDDAMDREKLPELKKAIRESAISIIVFSRNYASSKWCLDEVLTIIEEQERLSSKHEVVPVFYDVEPSDVRNQTGIFEEAFGWYDNIIEGESNHHQKISWMEKVKAWRASLRKAGSLTGMILANGYKDKELFLHVACFFVGEDKEFIVKLLAECDLYPIVGIKNLMDRCLLYIENGRVMMHPLIKEIGQEVVRRESPEDPGK